MSSPRRLPPSCLPTPEKDLMFPTLMMDNPSIQNLAEIGCWTSLKDKLGAPGQGNGQQHRLPTIRMGPLPLNQLMRRMDAKCLNVPSLPNFKLHLLYFQSIPSDMSRAITCRWSLHPEASPVYEDNERGQAEEKNGCTTIVCLCPTILWLFMFLCTAACLRYIYLLLFYQNRIKSDLLCISFFHHL